MLGAENQPAAPVIEVFGAALERLGHLLVAI
jgi:hypothetical protein